MKLIAILMLLAGAAQAATLSEQMAAVPYGTWSTVATSNTLASVKPVPTPAGASGFMAKWAAWNSGAFFPRLGACGTIAYWGGGHNDYWGSEVTGLDICGPNGPTWVALSAPYIPPAGESYFPRMPCGAYTDGSPAPPHTYNSLVADTDRNLLVTISAQSNANEQPGAPEYAACAWALDLATKTWRGPWPHSGAKYASAAYDSDNKLVWFEASADMPGVFSSLDPSTGTITPYAKSPNVLQNRLDAARGYDPVAKRLVVMSFRNGGTLRYISEKDPLNPTVPGVTMTSVNMPTLAGQQVMAWSPARKAWIVWANLLGADVYEAKRTVDGASVTYVWTKLTDAANTFNPGGGTTGAYQKLQLVTLANGDEVLMGIVNPGAALTSPVIAFKVPLCNTCNPPPPPPPTGPTCIPQEYNTSPALQFCAVDARPADACNQPGVFVCERFADGVKSGAIAKGTATPTVADGVLNMTIPPLSGADPAGHVRWTFPPVGEGQTIAFSYRVKADKATIADNAIGRKEFILWRGASSCTDLEFSMTHEAGSARIVPYTNCGARNFYQPLGTYDFRLQYPDFACRYHDRADCAVSVPDKWQTYYFEIQVGHYGKPDSRLVMWQRTDGVWKRFVERPDYVLEGSGGFNNFMLTAYQTGRTVKERPAGLVQFDDLIVSTQSLSLTDL